MSGQITHPISRHWLSMLLAMLVVSIVAIPSAPASAQTPTPRKVVGYFTAWSIYDRAYTVKNIATSGSASVLTHINYAFSNVAPAASGSQVVCQIGDPWADYQKTWTAAESVNGIAVPWGGALRGNFQQLKALKAKYPNIKVLISLGGWTWSQHFSNMAITPASRTAFVKSCVDMFIKGDLPRDSDAGGPGAAAGVFDGIDIDWEFPGVCGNTCDFRPEDRQNFTALLQEFRRQLTTIGTQNNKTYLLTIASSANPETFAKLQLPKIQQSLDFINVMAYDIHGSWDTKANFNAPLYRSPNDPDRAKNMTVSEAMQGYLNGGVPASKLVMGTPFYGRGWTGVPSTKGGLYQTATGPAAGTYEAGIEDFKVLKAKYAAGGWVKYYDTVVQNAWLYNPTTKEWWSFDNPQTQTAKASYVKSKNLGGMMIWDLSGDSNGELIKAIGSGLK